MWAQGGTLEAGGRTELAGGGSWAPCAQPHTIEPVSVRFRGGSSACVRPGPLWAKKYIQGAAAAGSARRRGGA
jgi:hypothetical protein